MLMNEKIELVELHNGLGYYGVEVKTKIEGKTRFIDVRVAFRGLTLQIEKAGVAANKNRNYKYIDSMDNEYRYYKGVDRLNKVRDDILRVIPREVLQFALDTVYSEIKIENEWFK